MVLWVKSYCVGREELIHDALTHCCGVWAHTEGITSHPESFLLQQSNRHSLAVHSHNHLSQSKQLGRNKPESTTSGRWPACHEEGMAVTCECELCQQVPILAMTIQVTSWPGPGQLVTQALLLGTSSHLDKLWSQETLCMWRNHTLVPSRGSLCTNACTNSSGPM